MKKSIYAVPAMMWRACRFDRHVFAEAAADKTAGRRALAAVTLASLAAGTGMGLAGFIKMAGAWFLPFLLGGIGLCLAWWFAWTFCAWIIGRVFISKRTGKVTFGELLRATGFAASPGVLGLLVFIPVIGVPILLIAALWIFAVFLAAVKQVFGFGPGRAFTVWAGSGAAAAALLITGVAVWVVSGLWFGGNWPFSGSLDSGLNPIVQPYRFSIGAWELINAPAKLAGMLSGGKISRNSSATVSNYFASGDRPPADVDSVEKILENQIRQKLVEENLYGFPPVNLQLTPLPKLLIISPKDRIETTREIFLDLRLTPRQIDDIEKQADALGVSSLVVEIGGFGGAYPSMVANDASLKFTIDAAVEEWLHQYLAFRPLGFRYLMDIAGIQRNYEIATINEAVAGMVSQELGGAIRSQYYKEAQPPAAGDNSEFYRRMRETRLAVDDYLAKGQVAAAEQFMEQSRQELAKQGYHIRKLNQAYFAWYGTYADQPESVSPAGEQLRELRAQCGSVKQFLDIVSQMTSGADLTERLAISR